MRLGLIAVVFLLAGCGTFTAEPKYTRVVVTWEISDSIAEKCGFNALACAKWKGNKCTIITPRQTTMETVGHEVRHCFEGHWHD